MKMKLYNEFTSIHQYFAEQIILLGGFESLAISKMANGGKEDILCIAWTQSLLDLSGCIDSPAENQWHCDPAYCPDWETPRKGAGSLLTVASIAPLADWGWDMNRHLRATRPDLFEKPEANPYPSVILIIVICTVVIAAIVHAVGTLLL